MLLIRYHYNHLTGVCVGVDTLLYLINVLSAQVTWLASLMWSTQSVSLSLAV